MRFTDIFISRPVLAICINLIVLVAGYQAIQSLSVRQYPQSDLAVITISTVYVGANADLVRGYITTPLERVIASADGIDYLESSSVHGRSTITAHLRLNFDINAALTQIQAKVAQVRNELPPEAEAPVINAESADNRFASMYLSFYAKDLEQNQITDYLTRVVQPRLSALQGVQKADILGARTFAMRIWLKPDRMAALEISPSEVRDALARNNYLSAVGTTRGTLVSVNLTANTDLKSREEFEQLIVREDGDTVVRLSDVAEVVLGAESYDEEVRFSGQTAVFMGVWPLPNANSLDVIKRVRDALPYVEADLPSGMQLGVPYDATAYIRDAIFEVIKTLTETVLIVILVIFLFIGSLRAVLVPMVAIPLSLVGAAAMMLMFGFTINLLTLLAIVLAVGLVVDDAIVMLENVERHVANGLSPLDAAFKAGRELAGPITVMTVTLAAVYTPIAFQGGLTGALFREFALTLAGAVFVSGFVALTLSPMMSSRLVKPGHDRNRFKERVDSAFAKLHAAYQRTLSRSLRYRFGIAVGAFLLMTLTIPFYLFSTKELAPREDQGVVFGIVQASPNASIEETTRFTEEVNKVYEQFPEYSKSFQLTNPQGGFSGMLLKPWSERSRDVSEIEGEAWGKASTIPGVRVIITSPPPLPGGSDFPVEFVISSTEEPARIFEYSNKIVQRAFESGVFMFADSDLKYDFPESSIIIDREKAALMGLSLADIGADIAAFTGGDYINRFNVLGRSYKVIAQGKRTARLVPEQLLGLYVSGPQGTVIPLSTIATIEHSVQPRALNRFQQLNSAKIQGAQVPGVSIDQALSVLESAAAEVLPPGYAVDYAGESRQLRKEGDTLTQSLLLALLMIFLVLAAQFESFRDPLIILAGSVPLALTGALMFVFFDFTSLNIYSQVGLVTLVGLVSKNGILIVEFANQLQREGKDKLTAIIEAASVRLRPVLMTSVATVVGHFPLILASGAGAGARNSIGWVLVTGMIIGTVFTLFVVPVIYLYIARDHRKAALQSDASSHQEIALNGRASPIPVSPQEALVN
jgi:multidrug efflux pump